MSDEFADDVQPEVEGQGGESTEGGSPYSEYLERIPEDARGAAEEAFKAWDAKTTQRFQEASEHRKSWEPYEQVGVNQYDPAAVQWALQFFEAQQSNPQAVQQWFQAYAQEHGLAAAQEAAAQLEQQDEYGYADPQQQLEQLLAQRLSPYEQQLQQLQQHIAQQDYQQAQVQAEAFVEGQLKELEEKHGDEFDRKLVELFVTNHLDRPEQAVQLAFEQSKQFRNQIEKQVLQSKVNAPGPAESGGIADTNPEKITTFKQAAEIALATMRNQKM